MSAFRYRAAAVALFVPLHAPSSGVTGLSVVPAAGRAEVVITVDPSVRVHDFRLPSPERVVVDLQGARLEMPARGLRPRVTRRDIERALLAVQP